MAVNPFKSIENEIKRGFSKLGDEIKGSINKTGNDIKHNLSKAGKDIEHSVNAAGDTVKKEVLSVGNKAIHDIEGLSMDATHDIKNIGDKIKHDVEDLSEKAIDELEDKVKEGLESLFQEVARTGLKRGVSILKNAEKIGKDALKDSRVEVSMSFLVLAWDDIGDRAGTIRKNIESIAETKPRLSRSYIMDVINRLSPDEIALDINIKLAALIVTSDDLAAGFKLIVPRESFIKSSDGFLEAVGL